MDSNGIISFEVSGKKYTACFGMKFKHIFGEILVSHEGETTAVDWFTYQLYAALCNEAYLNREPYPIFRGVVDLVDEILEHEGELQKLFYECYENSKAGKEIEGLLKALNPEKKSEIEERNSVESNESQNTSGKAPKLSDLPAENFD